MRPLRLMLCLALVAACSTATLPVRAQEEVVPTISSDGTELFRHVLHHFRMQPINEIDQIHLADPEDTMIIVLGEPSILGKIRAATGGFTQFTQHGGNVLIATDYETEIADLQIRIPGLQMKALGNAAFAGKSDCPWVIPSIHDGDIARLKQHPIFRFLTRGMVTNRPSWLIPSDSCSLQPLLTFPAIRNLYMAGSGIDASPEGRTLVIAGHGMFLNGLMARTDNDNFAFSVNAINWLREAQDGKRTKALLVVDGQIVTDFNAQLSALPPATTPPMPVPSVTMINRLLRGLEDERFFHRMLGEMLGDRVERFLAIVLGLITVALLIYGAKKFMEGAASVEMHVPLIVGPQAASDSTSPPTERPHAH